MDEEEETPITHTLSLGLSLSISIVLGTSNSGFKSTLTKCWRRHNRVTIAGSKEKQGNLYITLAIYIAIAEHLVVPSFALLPFSPGPKSTTTSPTPPQW